MEEGIVTMDGRLRCDICQKPLKTGDKVYTDGSRMNYHKCENCKEKEE